MKKILEPIVGVIVSMSSWELWRDFGVSLLLAFLGGALAYLGKYLTAKLIAHISKKKNVFTSKTRQLQNEAMSQDDEIII